jgi:hypothetical protein
VESGCWLGIGEKLDLDDEFHIGRIQISAMKIKEAAFLPP